MSSLAIAAAVLQAVAAVVAFRLGRKAGYRRVWITIATGELLLAAGDAAVAIATHEPGRSPDLLLAGYTGSLAGSALLAGGLLAVDPVLRRANAYAKRLRRQVTQTLSTNEQLRLLLDFAQESMMLCDRDGTILDLNRAAQEMLGLPGDALPGRNALCLVAPLPSEREKITASWRDAVRTSSGSPVGECRIATPAGEKVVAVRIHPVELADSKGVLVTGTDLTDRDRARAAVTEREHAVASARAAEHTLEQILDHAPAFVYQVGLDGKLQYVNRYWQQAAGRTQEDARGKSLHEVLPGNEAEAYVRNDDEVLRAGESRTFLETARIRGEQRFYAAVKFPLRDATGAVTALCAISTDITDRVRAEEKLSEQRRMLEAAQSLAHLGVWEWNAASAEFSSSPQVRSLLGLPSDATEGTGFDELLKIVSPADRDRIHRAAMELLFENRPCHEAVPITLPGGEVRWLIGEAYVDRESDGSVLRMFGFVQDITAQKLADERIRALNNDLEARVAARTAELADAVSDLSHFNSAVSHDLRQPLTVISGYLGLLEEDAGAGLPAKSREYISRARAAAATMDRLIGDLLALARTARTDVRRSSLDVSGIARRIAGELTSVSGARRVPIVVQDGLVASADAGLVQIILQNLLANAWKFTRDRDDARIEVGARPEGPETVFHVTDNGVGFDAEGAERLFQPFQRYHDASEFEGTGIGLATVARAVRRLGGRIAARSRPGCGAEFSFTLAPRHPASAGSGAASVPASPQNAA